MVVAKANAVPLDVKGSPISLELVKQLLIDDVAIIRAAVQAWESDVDECRNGKRCYPNVLLRRIVDYVELAHDVHWDWYRARLDAAAKGS